MIYSVEDSSFKSLHSVLVDSNVLIAFFDSKHKFHSEVKNTLLALYKQGCDFYYVQPCLLEFKEYWRRKMFSECIALQIAEGYNFYRKFEKLYKDFVAPDRSWTKLYLTDYQIKALRETLESISKGKGLQFWFKFCELALDGKLCGLETRLEGYSFQYAKFNDGKLFPIENKPNWPKWEAADLLQEKYGLASNDAAILNMASGAVGIDSFISNDGDILFAVANGALKPEVKTFTFFNTEPYTIL